MAAPLGGGFGTGTLGALGALASLGGGIAGIYVGYREAKQLEQAAVREARRIRRAGDRVLGAQTASYAHAGVTQQGTPQDVRNDTIAEIEREVFASTQQFDAAVDRSRIEGVMALADSLQHSAYTLFITGDSQKSPAATKAATALYGRNTLGRSGYSRGFVSRNTATLGE